MFRTNDESFTSDEGVMIDSDGEDSLDDLNISNISGINDTSQAHVAVGAVDADLKEAVESNMVLATQLASVTADIERMRREIEYKDRVIETQEAALRAYNIDKEKRGSEERAERERIAHDLMMLDKLGL